MQWQDGQGTPTVTGNFGWRSNVLVWTLGGYKDFDALALSYKDLSNLLEPGYL